MSNYGDAEILIDESANGANLFVSPTDDRITASVEEGNDRGDLMAGEETNQEDDPVIQGLREQIENLAAASESEFSGNHSRMYHQRRAVDSEGLAGEGELTILQDELKRLKDEKFASDHELGILKVCVSKLAAKLKVLRSSKYQLEIESKDLEKTCSEVSNQLAEKGEAIESLRGELAIVEDSLVVMKEKEAYIEKLYSRVFPVCFSKVGEMDGFVDFIQGHTASNREMTLMLEAYLHTYASAVAHYQAVRDSEMPTRISEICEVIARSLFEVGECFYEYLSLFGYSEDEIENVASKWVNALNGELEGAEAKIVIRQARVADDYSGKWMSSANKGQIVIRVRSWAVLSGDAVWKPAIVDLG